MHPMNRIITFILLLFSGFLSQAQQAVFSDIQSNEDADMDFNILGKSDSIILMYKKINGDHFMTGYDDKMQVVFHQPISCLPQKLVGIDFFLIRNQILMVFQQEKKGRIYCYGQKLNLDATESGSTLLLDSTRISMATDEDIYTTTISEDKQKLLVFKSYAQQGNIQLVSKLYDLDFNLLDSARKLMTFESKRMKPMNPVVNNAGVVFFTVSFPEGRFDVNSHLKLFWKKPGLSDWQEDEVDLKGNCINDVVLKMDERNARLLLAAPYMDKPTGRIQGIFAAYQDSSTWIHSGFVTINDSLRGLISGKKSISGALDGLSIRGLILKKSGGFLLVSEKLSEEIKNDHRYPTSVFGNFPYTGYNFYNPYYYGNYYRAPGYYSSRQSKRYYADDIVLLNLDSNLTCSWLTHIPKHQYEDDGENALSFCHLITGSGVHFYFLENHRFGNKLSDHLVQPDGKLKKLGELKALSDRYDFLPKLAKQVGAREILVPCTLRGRRVFAKISF